MAKQKTNNCVSVTIEHKDDYLCVYNDCGQKWQFPPNFSERVALASLVFGALINKSEQVSCYSSHFKISMQVDILD